MSDNPIIEFLSSRRSVLAAKMSEPSPSADDLKRILEVAIRVPDHGKIEPWRIQVIHSEGQKILGDLYAEVVQCQEPDCSAAKIEASRERLQRSPLLLVVSCNPNPQKFAKVPLIEQQLSTGAVCSNILIAAGALGYAAQWLTGGPAYEPQIKAALGLSEDADIIGFMHLGSVNEAPLERPRPDYDNIISDWPPRA
ncbi:MAG: nitroreductase [Pseudomonadota bacterium]